MTGYKVEICGVNTSTLPILKDDEKIELLKRIKNGDKKAKELFINANLRLVLSIVQRFSQSKEDIDDLFQVGCVGMLKAIDNFDISQNYKFSTYAFPLILGEVKRFLRDCTCPIRISRSIKDTAYKALQAKEALIRKNQKEPTISEIANELSISSDDIVIALEAIQPTVSIYEPVYSDNCDNLCIGDQISDKKNLEDLWVDNIALRDAMSKLNPREKKIIKLRFLDCKTQIEASKELNISQAQVSRLEKNALNNMRKFLS